MNADISPENIDLVESYLASFVKDPSSLNTSWNRLFECAHTPTLPESPEAKKLLIEKYIMLYRLWGHLQAQVYPAHVKDVKPCSYLQEFPVPEVGLYPTCGLLNEPFAPFDKIRNALQTIYCKTIGYEFWPFCDQAICSWLAERIEQPQSHQFDQKKQIEILQKLSASEVFETFLHTRYVGQKRFSLEGAETLIPMLSELVETSTEANCIIGMPHRGRLNVMVNLLQKSYNDMFSEFEDLETDFEGSGDVKYHKGYYSNMVRQNGTKVEIILAANPSHLESVDAVVEGMARAKKSALAIVVHGDAAISGQGVVYETFQLAHLAGYKIGGTIHIVINNHIGFTTLPENSRSTHYCTDIAKTFGIPVFHVNGEDPEACIRAVQLALEVRNRFHTDVCIDLNCFRKYGHNESDEPAFTQPLLYQRIRKKPSIRTLYHDALLAMGIVSKDVMHELDENFKKNLQNAFESIKSKKETGPVASKTTLSEPVCTHVPLAKLQFLLQHLTTLPDGFTAHPRIAQLFADRQKRLEQPEFVLDWAQAESLALATLLDEGYSIRFSGQDSRRGTFSQRHGMLVDQLNEASYFPLGTIHKGENSFELIDSPLSEYAALGFEYGYSLAAPNTLVIWEAQFGDFANGAQILIDQYIAAGEQKWGSKSRLCLFLPHGYEGQGPEHSSARIERFLTLCAEENMYVCNPTTPAQFFHLLRRQCLQKIPKPLIVFTPKGLLRHPKCQSHLSEFANGTFKEVINDHDHPIHAKTVILCQGRIYYDLVGHKNSDVAIIRIEQLYPLCKSSLEQFLAQYENAVRFLWVQEEPQNMGAWNYMKDQLARPLSSPLPRNCQLEYRGRPASSSPAVGSHRMHEKELAYLIRSVFMENVT